MIDRRTLLSEGFGMAVTAGGLGGIAMTGAATAAAGASAGSAGAGTGADAGTGTGTGAANPAPAPARRDWRRVELRIRFMTTRDGRTFERGREVASYDFHADGLVTYHVSSHSDDPRISRDAIYTLGADWRPREAFVRLQVDGRYEGSGWFRFEPQRISSETFNAALGRRSETKTVDVAARSFVAHPVSTDVMLAAAYEHGGPRRQRLPGCYTSSADPYGRVGPSLAPSEVWLEYVGQETLATPAGAMAADRYELFTAAAAQESLETLWTLPGTSLFLRAQARGVYSTVYELVDFRAT